MTDTDNKDLQITVDEKIVAVQREEYELLKKKYITQKKELKQLRAEREGFVELIDWINDYPSVEINPSNYNHDDVCNLNAGYVEIVMAVGEFKSKLTDSAQRGTNKEGE